MTSRSERLRVYLAEGARLPFVWGERDCCPWACGWAAAERGVDPLASIRGAYRSAVGCARLLHREGGLVALARRLMTTAGFTETERPVPGDIGIVETAAGPMGGICLPRGWAVKTRDGLAFVSSRPIVAWSV